MASHPQTFVRIIGTDNKCISCDVNQLATMAPLANTRGEYPTKIQGWEILFIRFKGTIPLVRFRNPLGVFLGVDTIDNNSDVKAHAGLDDNSLWGLHSDGKIGMSYDANNFPSFLLTISGTGIQLTSSTENPTLWGTDLHLTIPPLFHNPSA